MAGERFYGEGDFQKQKVQIFESLRWAFILYIYFILFLFGPRSCQRVQVPKESIKKVLVEEYQNSQWLQGSFVWACAHAAPGIFLRSVPNSDIGLWAALLMSLGSLRRQIKLLIDSIIDHVECDASSSVSEGCAFRCFQCDFFKQLIDVDMECDADGFHNCCSREAFPLARSTSLHKH